MSAGAGQNEEETALMLPDFRVPKVRPAALAAANWWAIAIGPEWMDNGDIESSLMLNALNSVGTTYPVTEHHRLLFREILALDLDDKFEAGYGIIPLDVDYNPCESLHYAATSAGMVTPHPGCRKGEGLRRGVSIPSDLFPLKTNMTVKLDEVTVSAGYRAEWVTIYPETTDA